MSAQRPARGRPVTFFVVLLAGWAGLRVATFELPWPIAVPMPPMSFIAARAPVAPPASAAPAAAQFPPPAVRALAAPMGQEGGAAAMPEQAAALLALVEPAPERTLEPVAERAAPAAAPEPFVSGRQAVGHNLAWMAAMANLPMPASVAALIDRREAQAAARQARWSGDAWLLMRQGGAKPSPGGALLPSYGASQLGAVLAYRIAPASALQPAAYLRASRALVHDGESEAALGLKLRPVAGLPVSAHVEMRATHRPGPAREEVRAAAFVAGGFDRARLPLGVTARGYAQAGYVGGDYATAFVDGSAVAEKELARFDLGRIGAGGGVWGGAQKGAERLDIGPTASVAVSVAKAPLRLSLDYRQRVAGDAAPKSSGALTLTTGF